MTDRSSTASQARNGTKPARKKRLGPKPVFAVGLVTFVAFLSLLGWQVAAGKDPALGHGFAKSKAPVVHRHVRHVVVTKVYDAPTTSYDGGYSSGGYSSGGYSSGGSSSSGSSSSSSGGGSYSPAPTYSAPAPSYTPPAPTVSSGSSGG